MHRLNAFIKLGNRQPRESAKHLPTPDKRLAGNG
nr:MAG TPA: hypothetical protein [Caudoviricetes sp.]